MEKTVKPLVNKMGELIRYREGTEISQSLLTSISKNPGALVSNRKDTNYFTLGSLVDTLAFFGEEGVDLQYFVSTVKKPTDLMLEYHQNLLDCILIGHSMEEAKDLAFKQTNTKLSRNTIEERYKSEVLPYLKQEVDNPGKILIQKSELSHAKALVKLLHSDKYASKYFKAPNEFQVVVKGDITGIPCKGLIDILEIDEVNKTMRVVDLKTTSKPTYSFYKSILSYRYDLQLAFYTELLRQQEFAKGYKILIPRLVVINVSGLEPPIVFELSEHDLKVAELGGVGYDGIRIKGYFELLQDYLYISNSGENYYPDYVANNGVLQLNLYAGNLEI